MKYSHAWNKIRIGPGKQTVSWVGFGGTDQVEWLSFDF